MHDAEIQKAIDDYLEMERKARAWDALYESMDAAGRRLMLAQMDDLVHPAQEVPPR